MTSLLRALLSPTLLSEVSPSPLLILGGVLAGLAAWLAVPAPAGRLGSAGRPQQQAPAAAPPMLGAWQGAWRPPGWRGLFVGRADAAPAGRRVVLAIVAALAVGGGARHVLLTLGWAAAPLVGLVALAGFVGLGLLEPASARERSRRLVADSPTALELLAAGLAAGLPPRTATAAVASAAQGPVSADLGVVLHGVDLGLSDAQAWRLLADHPTLGLAALDLARSVDSGARLAETLLHHAERARERRSAALEVSAKAVGVRCVLPMMCCFIPAFLLLGIVPTVVSTFLARLPPGIFTP